MLVEVSFRLSVRPSVCLCLLWCVSACVRVSLLDTNQVCLSVYDTNRSSQLVNTAGIFDSLVHYLYMLIRLIDAIDAYVTCTCQPVDAMPACMLACLLARFSLLSTTPPRHRGAPYYLLL